MIINRSLATPYDCYDDDDDHYEYYLIDYWEVLLVIQISKLVNYSNFKFQQVACFELPRVRSFNFGPCSFTMEHRS
jgi:hypothetical protein